MFELTEEFIEQCSTILGRYHNEIIDLILRSFRNEISLLPNCLKDKFQRLIPNENISSVTIQLVIINHFKQRYFSELIVNNNRYVISIEDELNLAYAFLFAKLYDLLTEENLDDLKLLFRISQSITTLLELYQRSGDKFKQFFLKVCQCASTLRFFPIKVQTIIEDFNKFLIQYEDFLNDFRIYNDENNLPLLNQNSIDVINSFVSTDQIFNKVQSKSVVPNIPRKGLCVIINISEFTSSKLFPVSEHRKGSDKDVEIIKTVFKKLKFTILESKFSFKQENFNAVLNKINDKNECEYYDCLVIFIMSHGFLHSFLSGDSQEVIVRNFIKYFSDTSIATIWVNKTRLFFIQACRLPCPINHPSYQNHTRIELKQNDLSPKMIVAYSCSPREESKRNIDHGSYYIQIFCLVLLKFSHCMSIQNILEYTTNCMVAWNKCRGESNNTLLNNQRPEYIEREFNSKFRLSDYCLLDNYSNWTTNEQIVLDFSFWVWNEIHDFMKKNPIEQL